MSNELVNGLGGSAGFGENVLNRNDDSYTSFIDLHSVFGEGLNFFGNVYSGLYLNNNGSVTFAQATGTYTPTAITGQTNNPMIAAYWADVDTRGGGVAASPGGTSTGTNLLWYDLDTANHVFTATWDDVGYFSYHTDKLNAFQIRLTAVADAQGNYNGDFNIEFRYEQVDWTTGDASGGSGGLGGVLARAGYTSGNGVNYYELSQSGNQAALLDLENASNIGDPGRFLFAVRNGAAAVTAFVDDVSVAEGNGAPNGYAVIPVRLSAPSATPVTVSYALSDGTARAGSDYVDQRGTLTFAPGVTSQNVYVELVGDRVVEADETFRIHLTGVTGAQISDNEGIATIRNDDGLSVADVRLAEGTGTTPTTMTFTVSLLSAAAAPVTVNYATANGTATAGSDYTATSGTLTFAAGETSKQVSVAVAADSTAEADETFQLRLSGASGAPVARATATGTIVNDDGLVIDDARVTEGTGSGTTSAPVTIRLLSAAATDVTVHWQTVAGTAQAGADFTAQSGDVTIARGQTAATIQIPVVQDARVEGNETFQVRLSSPHGTALVDSLATVTIVDDDGFSVSDVTVVEGTGGSQSAVFSVTLSSALAEAATVTYATANGTARAGTDYTATSGTLSFAAGETVKTVAVPIITDAVGEGVESFAFRLSNASANTGIARASATGTIVDDDGLRVSDASITEGNSGTTQATVTVSLSSAATQPVTVNWATADGTAAAGSDYVAAHGSLSFAAGETSKTIAVQVKGDTAYEPNETFRVVLSDPVNTAIVDGSGTVTITNDDTRPPPALSITDASITEGTGAGTTMMRFVVGLSYAASSAVSVSYATANGTAAAGSDYTATSGTLTIPAGSLYGLIEVPVLRDAVVEGNETFTLALSNPTGGATIDDGSARGTILNDDAALSIAARSAARAEGNSGATPFTFTVTRSGDTAETHSVAWTVAGTGTHAANAADFTGGALPHGTVTFAAGQTSKIVTVNVAGDTAVESNETFRVTLSGASQGATIDTAAATGTIQNDDVATPAELSIAARSASRLEGNSGSTPFTFTVTRSGDTAGADSVAWAVTGTGTHAANAYDFTGRALPHGTVSFAAGETSKTVTVNVAGDSAVESNETFRVTLSGASEGAEIGTASAIGTIRNDDARLTLTAGQTAHAEGNSGSTPFTFTLTRSGDTAGTDSADWAVTGTGTHAANAYDFTGRALPHGTVSFAAGETSKVITVNVAGDTAIENDETFAVTLSNLSAGATTGTRSVQATITNDDRATDDLLIGTEANQVLDGGAGNDTVTYAGLRTAGVTVDLSVSTTQSTGGGGLDRLISIENLIGSNFNDVLSGSSGANRLTGGKGADQLAGRGGADVFVYTKITDSTPELAGRDRILDFSHAQGDRIDVSAIDADPSASGNQAFRLVEGDFTGGARELSISTWGTTNLLRFDLDKDGVADFAITVVSATAITAADLIL